MYACRKFCLEPNSKYECDCASRSPALEFPPLREKAYRRRSEDAEWRARLYVLARTWADQCEHLDGLPSDATLRVRIATHFQQYVEYHHKSLAERIGEQISEYLLALVEWDTEHGLISASDESA